MTDQATYPCDLSNARRALIAPHLTAWRQSRTDAGVGGRTATHDLREIFNAILYVNRTGIALTSLLDYVLGQVRITGRYRRLARQGRQAHREELLERDPTIHMSHTNQRAR